MMKICFFFFLFFVWFSNLAVSQNDEIIIDSSYKYRNLDLRFAKEMPHGIYIFKTDVEYITFMSQNYSEGLFHPLFFSNEEMGLIIRYQSPSIGSGKKVYAVFETASYIVVQIRAVRSNIQFYVVNEQQLCIALKKSRKEVIIQEIQSD